MAEGDDERRGHGPLSRSDDVSACSIEAALKASEPPLWFWRGPRGEAQLGTGEAIRVVAEGDTRFGRLEDGIESLTDRLGRGPGAAKVFVGGRFFPLRGRGASSWDAYPTTVAAVPSTQLAWTIDGQVIASVVDVDPTRDLDEYLTTVKSRYSKASGPNQALPRIIERHFNPTKAQWQSTIADAVAHLERPPLEKAVIAGSCHLELDGSVSLGSLITALIERHPDCWVFAHAPTADTAFVGASPERLASVTGNRLQTVALAGSIGRGDTPQADERLARQLLDREHDRNEQAAVVGDIVHRLGQLTKSIQVGERTIRRLSDVQHIETPIEATLREGSGLLDVAGELHPTPAVGGRPRASALALINRIESVERGWYAAPFGLIDPDGEGDLIVAIRSARIDRNTATLYAGNGIVDVSDPAEEWEELLLKFQAMTEVFGG